MAEGGNANKHKKNIPPIERESACLGGKGNKAEKTKEKGDEYLMDELKKAMQKRIEKLEEVIRWSKNKQKKLPEGRLTIKTKDKKPQYYVMDEKNVNGIYISKKNIQLARDLAQ